MAKPTSKERRSNHEPIANAAIGLYGVGDSNTSRGIAEGLFLATSEELPGLVAQGRTVAEAIDIARDVARKLIEARREPEGVPSLPTTSERRDYTIVVSA